MGLVYRDWTAQSALNPTGGFLGGAGGPGYTHTFNPAIGCAFAAGFCGRYCYARGFAERQVGAGTWGRVVYLKSNAPALVRAELERAARRDPAHRHHVAALRVFSASTTDPCAGRALALYREVLGAVADFPIARWVVQTRAPAVVELAPELARLGPRAVVSFTLETDDDALWRRGPAGAPGIAARRRAFEELQRALAGTGVRRHVAVAPLLPLAEPERFADWIAAFATDATVDTFATGDGSAGRRTASSELPELAAELGFDWRARAEAERLFDLLRERLGERAGWSAAGFARLAH